MAQAVSPSLTEFGERLLDPHWRVQNLYTIVTDDGKELPFRPNEEQMEFLRGVWTRNLILKARQLGFTTLAGILALDQCLFNTNFSAGIIAHNLEDAEKIFWNKILTPYRRLPEAIRMMAPLEKETASSLRFANGSHISVGTSMRSGTLQLLHVSEFGKICAKYPHKAREIVTGSFEAVAADQIIIIESTAEGAEGYFYEYCSDALHRKQEGTKGTKLDWRLHFYPWWNKPGYELDPEGVIIEPEDKRYFLTLEGKGIELSARKKAWYVTKKRTLKGDMTREYPSFPEEAFEQTIEGAIYLNELAFLRKNGRITEVPWEPGIPVNTFWDLGVNDKNAIWFHQRVGLQDRFINYYENSGEGLAHYWNWIKERCEQDGWILGRHYLPHDADARMLGEQVTTRKKILEGMGMRNIVIVPRVSSILTGIEQTRNRMKTVWIDREKCSQGIKCLDHYQREWDEKNGVFKATPLHNWASNGSDAFRQFGQGYDPVAEEAWSNHAIFSNQRLHVGRAPASRVGY